MRIRSCLFIPGKEYDCKMSEKTSIRREIKPPNRLKDYVASATGTTDDMGNTYSLLQLAASLLAIVDVRTLRSIECLVKSDYV